jgi:purine-binding chemotaxis protein CheW
MAREKNKHKNTFLSFRIGREIFAVSVKKVLEVLEKQNITEIPDVPDFVKGVINFRGDILPVIDTRIKFKVQVTDSDKFVVIVLEITENDKSVRIGAIVDSVKDVIAVDDADIKPVPELGLKYKGDFLSGMVKTEEGFTMILDINRVFTFDEIEVLAESEQKMITANDNV